MQHTNWNRRPTSTEALSDKLMSRSLSVALAGHCVRHFEFDEASHHTILWEPTHGKSRRRAPCMNYVTLLKKDTGRLWQNAWDQNCHAV